MDKQPALRPDSPHGQPAGRDGGGGGRPARRTVPLLTPSARHRRPPRASAAPPAPARPLPRTAGLGEPPAAAPRSARPVPCRAVPCRTAPCRAGGGRAALRPRPLAGPAHGAPRPAAPLCRPRLQVGPRGGVAAPPSQRRCGRAPPGRRGRRRGGGRGPRRAGGGRWGGLHGNRM